MKCFYYFLASVVVVLCGCSKSETTSDLDGQHMSIYNATYPIGEVAVWRNTPNMLFSTEEYIYSSDDTAPEPYEIVGEQCGKDVTVTGNFVLSIYENGFLYNEELNDVKGSGAVITFHITSSDTESIVSGDYSYSTEVKPLSFRAYNASDYSSIETINNIADIIDGVVNVTNNGDGTYKIKYFLQTTFGGEVKGEYEGAIRELESSQMATIEYSDLTVGGYQGDKLWQKRTSTGMWGGTTEGYVLDTKNKPLFITSTGILSIINQGLYSNYGDLRSDILLCYNADINELYFETPIKLKELSGHNQYYNYTIHTEYFSAPSDFDDERYANVETTEIIDFLVGKTAERITFDPSNFSKKFIFFRSGLGLVGVIRVRDFTPGAPVEEVSSSWFGTTITEYTSSPKLLMDVKCPGTVANPKIK